MALLVCSSFSLVDLKVAKPLICLPFKVKNPNVRMKTFQATRVCAAKRADILVSDAVRGLKQALYKSDTEPNPNKIKRNSMRLIGWPTLFDKEQGLLPIDLQDVDVVATSEELRVLAKFLEQAADKISQTKQGDVVKSIGIDFSDSKENSQTAIWINVVQDLA